MSQVFALANIHTRRSYHSSQVFPPSDLSDVGAGWSKLYRSAPLRTDVAKSSHARLQARHLGLASQRANVLRRDALSVTHSIPDNDWTNKIPEFRVRAAMASLSGIGQLRFAIVHCYFVLVKGLRDCSHGYITMWSGQNASACSRTLVSFALGTSFLSIWIFRLRLSARLKQFM